MGEVDGEDAVGLRGQELLPGRFCAAGRWVDAGSLEDLPDGGRGDVVAESDEFALDPSVSPCRVLPRQLERQVTDGQPRYWAPGLTPRVGAVALRRWWVLAAKDGEFVAQDEDLDVLRGVGS